MGKNRKSALFDDRFSPQVGLSKKSSDFMNSSYMQNRIDQINIKMPEDESNEEVVFNLETGEITPVKQKNE